jgi:acetyl esterase/lipase
MTDRVIPGSNGVQIPIRVYTPGATPGTSGPCLVVAHSGGFITGNLETEAFICQLLCRSHGLVVVDIDYCLSPEFKYPAGVFQCYDVVAWIAGNQGSIGADLSKGFLLGGVSAGGNYLNNVAYMARDAGLQPALTGLFLVSTGNPHVLVDPDSPTGFNDLFPGKLPSWEQNKNAPISNRATNLRYGGMYLPASVRE